ncbi:MAG: methionyl-tRNA formyltransferase [Tissierella sp.]|uniref:methionyl-tRNA formyltransferase n=1 Tax=Tissierella sp. TaxID=41274 RepID=UPI003F96E4BF
MSKTKIIFMGTPDFATVSLEALYENNYDIKLVITQGDKKRGRGKKLQYPSVKQEALDLGLEVYQPKDINSKESIEKLKNISPDFIVVVAFGQILKKEILDIPKYKCINVHASLLPKFRGAAPINHAIFNDEKETGVTIMEMEEGLDTGDMISKSSIPILHEDDYISLHNKLAKLGADLLIKTIKNIKENNYKSIAQDDSLSSYASMIYKSTGKINWNNKGKDIINLIRGLVPWPVAHTSYKDINFKIYNATIVDKISDDVPGKIVKVSEEGIFINTCDSTLIIKELQFPNKKRMSVENYLRGNNIEVGIKLE